MPCNARPGWTQKQWVVDAEFAENLERQKAALREALIECAAWFQLDQFRHHPTYAKDSEVGRRMLAQMEATLAATKPTP